MRYRGSRGVVGTRAGTLLFAAGLFLVLVVAALPGVAFGAEAAPETTAALPTSVEAGQVEELTDLQTAEELPHLNLGREEVVALLQGVFEPELEAPAGFLDELEVEEFVSNHAAVISDGQRLESNALSGDDGADEASLLLESSLPLRQEGQAVDLSLEQSEGSISPANAPVPIEIPENLGEGIKLPEAGIEVSLAGAAAERTPSIVEATAVYPNVSADSDFVVAPSPTGFETFTSLRGPESPRSERLQVKMPAGAELKEDGKGAVVEKDGTELLRIPVPSALDAAGAEVPVSMSVDGDSLVLTVSPDEGTAWPILLDPSFETYAWEGNETPICSDFRWRLGPSGNPSPLFSYVCGTAIAGANPRRGIVTKANAGAYSNGTFEEFSHEVPRLAQEEQAGHMPTSYVAGMTLSNIYLSTGGGTASPYAVAGIWDSSTNAWAGLPPSQAVWLYALNGAPQSTGTVHITSGNDHNAKLAVANELSVIESGASTSSLREFFIGGATFEVGDDEAPELVNPSGGTWINGSAKAPITVNVRDTGLGAKYAKYPVPGQGTITVTNSCLGTVASPCPSVWTASLGTSQYNPALMPQGEDFIRITGEDVVHNASATASAQVLVDHTAPALALSGNLTEQGTVGTKLTTYTLNYAAADGDETAASATTPIGTAGTGTGQMQRPMSVAVDQSGNVWMVDRENNRVEEFNAKGEFIRQFGTSGSANGQFSDPRGIAISSAGNVWVSDLGNSRLQEFTSKGEFIRKVTYENGISGFLEPLGIATGPEETLWVTDIASHRVFQFKENGTFIRSISKISNPSVTFTTPTGIAVDRYGNAYIAEQASNQIVELSPTGTYIQKFGSTGTGEAQFKAPNGIAIAASGNVFLVDAENSRVQEFKPDGTFLRQFGSAGAASNQLSEPRGIAVAPGNEVLIADAANHRLARWTHADKDPQSGAAKVEVKVDGTAAKTEAPGCSTKNCQISGSWTLNADNYAPGTHKVEVIVTDGVGLTTTKTLNVETHGDYAPPSIALSGTMTEQGSLGTTLPTYKLKAAATDPGSAEERKSGVASETIKLDGAVVDSSAPGCPAEGCSLTREWTLESSTKSAGTHKVEVIAADTAGHTTTKTLEITIERDTTAPVLETGEEKFFTAPGGWLEQKSYEYFAAATDENGYGVTSLQLKIDGTVVKSTSGSCSAGGCYKLFFSSINMGGYKGGEHQAELIATDGAGNWRKRTWTLRVDPAGPVGASEATSTLEAAEDTAPEEQYFQPVAPTSEVLEPEEIAAGDNPHLIEEDGSLISTGVTTSTEIDQSTGGVSIEGTAGPLDLEPVAGVKPATLVEGSAAVLPSSTTAADTTIRPEYNGAEMFTIIRDATAPEEYSWRINLRVGQSLEQVDAQHVRVNWGDGEEAWMITAEPAHDALGHAVPTTLAITEGSNITLTVHHRESQVVYPVSAGEAYVTEYAVVTVEFPPPEEEAGEGYEEAEEGLIANEPLNASELEDANGFELFDHRPRRDPEKRVPLKQAKQMARFQGAGSASASGHVKEYPGEIYDLHVAMCSGLNCPIWEAALDEGTIKVKKNATELWNPEEPEGCHSNIEWWWTLNLSIDWEDIGHHKDEVKRNSGEHITVWCRFNISIYIVPDPDLPLPAELDQRYSLQDWIFPNGYQARHVYKKPPLVIEN